MRGTPRSPDRRLHPFGCLLCAQRVAVRATLIEPVVLEIATRWHAQASPDFLLGREVDNAMLPALEDALAAAKAELDAVEAAAGELSPLAYGKALKAAATAVQIAQLNVEQAETGLGWLGLDPATFGGEGALWDMPGAPSGVRISQKRLEEMRRTVLRPAACRVRDVPGTSGMRPERSVSDPWR